MDLMNTAGLAHESMLRLEAPRSTHNAPICIPVDAVRGAEM